MSSDRLDRFIAARDSIFETALGEIAAGRKRTHWMWFIFPQLAGLGRSPTAIHYGLDGLAEAGAYLAHPVLGDRLRRCVAAMLENRGKSAFEILGSPDDVKLRSCLTLFEAAASDGPDRDLFRLALEAFYGGARDDRTLAMLGRDAT